MNSIAPSFTQQIVASVLRQGLTAVGAWAVGRGYVDADTATQLVGALALIGATGWSVAEKLVLKKAG